MAEPTAEEIFREKLGGIYETGCFANDNQPNFYYREYEDVGLVAVYEAGVEAGSRIEMEKLKATLRKIESALDNPPIITKDAFGNDVLNSIGYEMALALEAARSFLTKLTQGEN